MLYKEGIDQDESEKDSEKLFFAPKQNPVTIKTCQGNPIQPIKIQLSIQNISQLEKPPELRYKLIEDFKDYKKGSTFISCNSAEISQNGIVVEGYFESDKKTKYKIPISNLENLMNL